MRIALLVGSLDDLDLSHAVYADGLRELGYEVVVGDVNSLSSGGADVTCSARPVEAHVDPFVAVPGESSSLDLRDADLVWMLNQPHPLLAQDTWQLLWRLNRDVPFVNDVTGLLLLNNKNNLPLLVPPEHLPRTLVSSDGHDLAGLVGREPDRSWVLKPTNSGAGSDVFVLTPGSTNNNALIESVTGNAVASAAVTRGSLLGLQRRYALLQEYVPHRHEKRVVIAGGGPTVQWGRGLADDEHRGNVSHGATVAPVGLSEDERRLSEEVGQALLRYGIRFAGLDVAYPAVFEVNLVNPGGLVEPAQLGIPDPYLLPALRSILDAVPDVKPLS